ncbi:MAG: restriction endonuclease subunit S [Kiritimatiellae bacterium]|nr:restriction endonuclease subunit S [Kiritimatiellia bacterium]
MNRPAFKNSELGPIPADWEVKRLGEICDDCGYGIGAEAVPFDGTNKYIRITDIDERSHRFKPSPLCSPSFVLEDRVVGRGDILVARTGASVGKSYIYDETDGHLLFAGFLMRVHVAKAEPRFVFYTTTTPQFAQWVLQESARSGQPGLNLAQLRTFCLAIPPLTEQRRIAAALSDADAWIESLDKLIEKKKLVKQGAMQALLSGKTRLPGFSGKWGEKRLGEIGEFRKGAGISREEGRSGIIPAVRYGELYTHHDCIIRAFGSHISEAIARRATLLKPGDILFACSGETKEEIGKCAAFIQPVRAYAGGDLLIMTPNPALCDSTFMGYALNSAECQAQKSASGQGDAVVHLHKDALEELEIRLPPTLAEQTAIAAVLSDMDAELAALSREKAKAEQIKQGMMQELLTGRTRLAEGE